MGLSKLIWEHMNTDCKFCEKMCEQTSEDIVKCMDRRKSRDLKFQYLEKKNL